MRAAVNGCEGSCCAGHDRMFDERVARDDLRRYRRRGPDRTTRLLLDALREQGVTGSTLLDIGGGVGVLQHELIAAGVVAATAVDASPAYPEAAREEAARRGYQAPVERLVGDFVALGESVPAADIVTLDRVVCCYGDMAGLVGASAAHARRLLGLVYPRPSWWLRVGAWVMNLPLVMGRHGYRLYVHETEAVDTVIRGAGLAPVYRRIGPLWQIWIYRRDGR